jgi:hypothetical protein
MDHYRCYKLVKMDTKQKVILDTVEFRHAYLNVPAVSFEDKITNGLQVMVGVLQNTPPPALILQLEAIKTLQHLFGSWKHLAQPALIQERHNKQTTATKTQQS